jgi:hypothetical protein
MDRCQLRRRCPTSFAAAVVSLVLLSAAGCSMSLPFAKNEFGPALPANAGAEEVVQRVNANIERLQAWRSSDLRISGRSLPVHLTGHIAVERPRNFRLTAGALGMTEEADFGSNADWFWLWVRRSNPPRVFRARHDDLEHSDALRQMIPFQPDWLIEALGVVPIDPKQVTRIEPGETHQTVNLISELLSPSGQPVQKVIRVDLRHGVVLGHYLYDASRRLIAKADLGNHELDRAKGVIMPHLITLEWPQAGMQINLELGQIEINPTTIPPRIWEVPNKEPNYASFDIGARTRARMPRDNGRPPGRVRLGAEGTSPVIEGNSAAFDNQFPAADQAPRSAVGRTSIEADNGQEWNKPIQSSDDAPDPRASRPPARVFSPGPSDSVPLSSSRATPPAAPGPRDPFASDAAWSNSQPAQGSPAATSDLLETAPR